MCFLTRNRCILLFLGLMASVALHSQSPETIFQLYNIQQGGCALDPSPDLSKKTNSKAGTGGVGSSPFGKAGTGVGGSPFGKAGTDLASSSDAVDEAPAAPASPETITALFEEYRKVIAAQPALPPPVRILNSGNILFFEHEQWGLKDANGKLILKPQFDFVLEDKTGFVAYKGGLCRYFDGLTGKAIIEQPYYDIVPVASNECIVRSAGGYGLVINGKTILEAVHSSISRKPEGKRWYYLINQSYAMLDDHATIFEHAFVNPLQYLDERFVCVGTNLIDLKRKRKLLCENNFSITILHPDKHIAGIRKGNDQAIFLIDFQGKLLSKEPFADLRYFQSGDLAAAAVTEPGQPGPKIKYGLIDTKGNWRVLPVYKTMAVVNNQWEAVDFDKKTTWFDLAGAPRSNPDVKIQPINDRYVVHVSKQADKTLSAVVDLQSGKTIREMPGYHVVSPFEGALKVCNRVLYADATENTREILDENFQPWLPQKQYYNFVGKYIKAYTNKAKEGILQTYYDCAGQTLTYMIDGSPVSVFREIKILHDSLTYVYLPNNKGYLIGAGNQTYAFNDHLRDINPFGKTGLYLVQRATEGEQYGVINSRGALIIPFQFKTVSAPAPVTGQVHFNTSDGTAGLLNSSGYLVGGQTYHEINSLGFNLYRVKKYDKEGVINHKGVEILPLKYEFITMANGFISASLARQKYLFDQTGQVVVEPKANPAPALPKSKN